MMKTRFKYSELKAKLSLNLYKGLQNAILRCVCKMEVVQLLIKMSGLTASLATPKETMFWKECNQGVHCST